MVLRGSAVRVTVNVHGLSPAGSLLFADVSTGASPVSLGALPAHGPVTLTGSLTGCPCVLRDLDLSPPPRVLQSPVTRVDHHHRGAGPRKLRLGSGGRRAAVRGAPVAARARR